MKHRVFILILGAILWFASSRSLIAQTVNMSYPGLTGESCPLWIAKDTGLFKQNGVNAELVYMEGGRLSIQSLLAGSTQFMAGDAVSAFSAIAGGADIILLASAENVLPYVFAVSKDIRRPQDLKGKIVATSQVGGRAGEIARMVVRNMGLDPDKDVTYLAVGGTMSRLAALSTGKVQAAPISHVVSPVAEERGLKILKIDPIPFIVDALWTTRKLAEENPKLIQDVVRSYVQAIATVVNDREKSLVTLRKYMRTSDSRLIQNAYSQYKAELDRVPIPSDKAIQNTLELSRRVAPDLVNIDIKRHLYFEPVRRLVNEGFIDRLYK